ncbi:Khsrp [Symbiodinium natans]|uniref:Khsrp protein n=1 Tax=Symbiodinium natans TaxID=878477 RepID=A0A812R3H4_9DINO|nr:Khsrp [Symbiodinium natans]
MAEMRCSRWRPAHNSMTGAGAHGRKAGQALCGIARERTILHHESIISPPAFLRGIQMNYPPYADTPTLWSKCLSQIGPFDDVHAEEKSKKDEKKEKKEDKKRDKDRDRDRDRGKDRRRDRDASRSASNAKRKKGKKEKERSRSRGRASRSRSSSGGKRKKESKLAEPPDWLPRSPEQDRPKAPLDVPRAPKSNPAPVPGEGRPAPQLPATKAPPENVPDWLQDLFGGQNSGNVAGPLLRPRVPHREVMVPQQCVARLIGKGGETIMGICNTTGADVKIRQETKELGYSLAIIMGHPDAMDAAERLVRQKLGLSGTGFASKELTLQSEHVPTVMGPKGTSLARIRQQSGNLAIEIRPPDLPGMPHTAMLGPGSQEQLMVAEQLIMATLAEAAVASAITNK